MDNYCNEVGQKMRSAVKAKLLELGTGGSAGYIDDELPDYVMIMVANKRSKQQMVADLQLFLGSQTELFVTWLHEVLQKLQEVTLPAPIISKKRKHTHKEDTTAVAVSKKDKKLSKKDKQPAKKSKESLSSNTNERPSTSSSKPITSITDLFAEELLVKVKHNLHATADAAENIKKSKQKKNSNEDVLVKPSSKTIASSSEHSKPKVTNEFDIPTISEISSTTSDKEADRSHALHEVQIATTSTNRAKDLAELAEIQKKIYAAKRQLKQLGEIEDGTKNDNDNDDDDDFLNLHDEDSTGTCNGVNNLLTKSLTPPSTPQPPHKKRSPIIFSLNSPSKEQKNQYMEIEKEKQLSLSPPPLPPIQETATQSTHKNKEQKSERRSVHQRLGLKANQSSVRDRDRRQEKELYVPTFRRKEQERERERDRDRDRNLDRDYDHNRGRSKIRERGRERERRSPRSRERQRNASFVRSRDNNSLENRTRYRSNSVVNHHDQNKGDNTGKITSTALAADRRRMDGSTSSDSSPHTPNAIQRRRIVSRVIVAQTKLPEPSDNDEFIDKPVNSVIKIKPRPPMSPSKQASKNLLMKAVAEAQRSIIITKASNFPTSSAITNTNTTSTKSKVSTRLGEKVSVERTTKLYTKSYRDRLKNSTSHISNTGNLFRRTTQNLIVEVNGSTGLSSGSGSGSIQKQKILSDLNADDEEYVPKLISDRDESDMEYVYVPQIIQRTAHILDRADSDYELLPSDGDLDTNSPVNKTQFVVTLNENKSLPKLRQQTVTPSYSRSVSPQPQVSSTSPTHRDQNSISSTTIISSNSNIGARKSTIKDRLAGKKTNSSSATADDAERVSRKEATTPPLRRTELIEIYRQHKDAKKIIIKSNSEDEEKKKPEINREDCSVKEKKPSTCSTPPSVEKSTPKEDKKTNTPTTAGKRKHTPITFDLEDEKKKVHRRSASPVALKKSRRSSVSSEEENQNQFKITREKNRERASTYDRKDDKRTISIRNAEVNKYDNVPNSLNSVPVDSGAYRPIKQKERCKYHPNCTKTFCEYYHPTSPCKSFPNCKYADKCMYTHPKCKYDSTCVNLDCNFSHTQPRTTSSLESSAPPLSSSVVPVQNYKSISANVAMGPVASTTCKYFPNCTKSTCPFYHPKPCRYGKNCINKFECIFYHQELAPSNKFKWVASVY